jgi:hypothetical protein
MTRALTTCVPLSSFCWSRATSRLGDPFFFDLVFYHRILKCPVLVDLKIGAFSHADAGQRNVYLDYYRENELTEGDNPPVGLILCAQKTIRWYVTVGSETAGAGASGAGAARPIIV